MAVTSQPGSFSPSDFQTNLFDCCSDCSTCLCGYFCLPCLGCSIASDMGECCLCGLGMPIRSVYRTKYNIKGSIRESSELQKLKLKPSCEFPHCAPYEQN
ncbi:hypothetical protein Q7C36_020426 [Tachysurus vachellii]|uniref:Uncharacterized protein n=1 Tax=Tachysurus vachellii TaxID=175792 RepID=A0AA88LTN4_TACVA|nr:hypothetical protein Q7C36_020426 [Tachysurus vachellii]